MVMNAPSRWYWYIHHCAVVMLMPEGFQFWLGGFWFVSMTIRPLRYRSVFISIEPCARLCRNVLIVCSPCSPCARSFRKFGGMSYSRIVYV